MTKVEYFYLGDKVLKWDSRREDKGKHGKFDFLWKGRMSSTHSEVIMLSSSEKWMA